MDQGANRPPSDSVNGEVLNEFDYCVQVLVASEERARH